MLIYFTDDKKHYGVRQAPCANRCSEFEAQAKKLSVIQQKGARIKQQYLATLDKQKVLGTNHVSINRYREEHVSCDYMPHMHALPVCSLLLGLSSNKLTTVFLYYYACMMIVAEQVTK